MTSQAQIAIDTPQRFTHQQVLRVLSGILLCIFLAAIDQTVVIPAVPAIAADLKVLAIWRGSSRPTC